MRYGTLYAYLAVRFWLGFTCFMSIKLKSLITARRVKILNQLMAIIRGMLTSGHYIAFST